jgi:hypothetical protein
MAPPLSFSIIPYLVSFERSGICYQGLVLDCISPGNRRYAVTPAKAGDQNGLRAGFRLPRNHPCKGACAPLYESNFGIQLDFEKVCFISC